MTGNPLAPVPQGQRMTPRARTYLAICAAQLTALAVVCLFVPETFDSSSYQGVKDALPFVEPTQALIAWGFLFAVGAVLATYSSVRGTEQAARAALLAAVVAEGCWLGGFLAAALNHNLNGPTGPIIWGSMLAKDMTMLRQPLRNPFEPLVRRILGR